MEHSDVSTLLLDYTQDKIAVVDDDGEFTYVNRATEDLLGFEPAELLGEDAFQYVHPEDREKVFESFERIVSASGYAEGTVSYRYRTADDSYVWFESKLSNLTDEALDGYVISSRDITDRMEAKEQQRESELKLQEIAERTSEVLWLFDADWTELLFINEACETVYGASVEEIEADPRMFIECIHPEDRPAVHEAMETLSSGTSVDMEYRVNPNTDYSNWAWVQGEPIVEDGEVVRIAGFARDITDRRRRERQLAVMDNLLRHNLRNDVNAIIANAELIEEAPEDDPAEKAAIIRSVGEDLIETAEKQREIISLLKEPVTTQRVDLFEATKSAVVTLTDRYPEATIQTDLQPVAAEALEQTELAVMELLENAIAHSEEPAPTVRITLREDGQRVELRINDHCPPIPDYEYRVLTGDQKMTATYHSSGLGLWLVYWIVDLSNGTIDFTRSDDGNTATVRLPRAE